jgi:sulfotransferase
MARQFHFISGLPRSGSTLLSAILRQNPRFHADMSGPLHGLFSSVLAEMSGRNEFSIFINDGQRKRLLAGLFENYYADFPQEVIFDTARLWCARLPALAQLFPQARMIACVRHLSWIIDSIETLVRSNAFSPSSIFNYSAGGTVYTRANGLASSDGMVGGAYDALREAFYGEHAGRLMLVQYETLSTDPDRVMNAVYDFIGEASFPHDFKNIVFDAREFDDRAGMPGLHDVRPSVNPAIRETILPPDLFRRFEHDAFWRDPNRNPHGVLVV